MRPKPLPRRTRPTRRRPRPVLALRRKPQLWWAVVVTLAVGVGWAVAATVSRAEAARLAWGDPVTVAVAARDLGPGDEVGHGDVQLVDRPPDLVPDGALGEVPTGQVVRAAVFEGEVLVGARLAPLGVDGLAATLPEGTRAVAIPVETGTAPPLARGDQVDVLVALPEAAAGGGPPGFAVTSDAVVVDVDEAAVTIAVERDVAPRIAVALGQGAVTLALVAP
jgi:Flp pilus assembly protein CpaB